MAKARKSATSTYLLKGAVFALEQCGQLLRDANCLYRNGSYASAVVLASFAREELGRANILFDLRDKVVAGESVDLEKVVRSCDDHLVKQEWAVVSMTYVTDKESELGKLLETRMRAHPQSEDWKTADKALRKLDSPRFKRAKDDRHKQRMRALYVDPDDSQLGWNRPLNVGKQTAYDFLVWAGNDYSVQLQKVDLELLKGTDERLRQELFEWDDRPTLLNPNAYPLEP
jgi:AbiV family abortive infection protein